MNNKDFYEIGKESGSIDVRVSYRIIQLFSDGLYSSPNKAIEELVTNSWDAGARHVHVILPADREESEAKIVVIDDGTGMDESGLRQHWLLGDSKKRLGAATPRGRKPIGKFGIGKLATYVLAHRLTHITKTGGKYFSTSMDYRRIDEGAGDAITEKLVSLSLRRLTEREARAAVAEWIEGDREVNKSLLLFGEKAADSWTVAVMSNLKHMAKSLSHSRLQWVLETAMPLSSDFKLYLNQSRIRSSKENAEKVGSWILGLDVGTEDVPLSRPAPSELEPSEDVREKPGSQFRYGLFHPKLQRITGHIDVFVDELKGKSEEWGQSSGFFVYVRGRRINIEDPGFGIDRNKLQHGAFSRFRMVVHMDGLDNELRSSRESVRAGEELTLARQILIAGFNFARSKLNEYVSRARPGAAMSARVADSPASLTTRPVVSLLSAALKGKISPRYFAVPRGLSPAKQSALLDAFDLEQPEFKLVEDSELVALSSQEGIAIYDVVERKLRINTMHPFVAHFLNEFEQGIRSLPLELFAISEVLLEAHLYQVVLEEDKVHDSLDRRDQLLRHLARNAGSRNVFVLANQLEEAAQNKDALEQELVNAFNSLGFEAVPLGKSGRPDGIASAHLPSANGVSRNYKVSLEAKSKEAVDGKVAAKTVNISAIARQRDDYECDHAIVVGPDFPASKEGKTALEKEMETAAGTSGKTITLIRVSDLAKLVRVQPRKRIGLDKLKELFSTCRTYEESAKWVDQLEALAVVEPPYRKILEVIWKIQKGEPDSIIVYEKLKTAYIYEHGAKLSTDELRNICRSMAGMTGGTYVFANDNSVELMQTPDKVLSMIKALDERDDKNNSKVK